MKRLFLALSLVLLSFSLAFAENTNFVDNPLVKEVEKYKNECSNKVYPDDYMDHVYSFTDDSLKEANQKYHQCIKHIITDKISTFASKEDKDKMFKSLDDFEKGVLNFYWILYNMEDNGYIGRQQNDAVLGRYYEQILEDIIHYEQKHQYY